MAGLQGGGNLDPATVAGFGDEWSTFTQDEDSLSLDERERVFAGYFAIFPWSALPAKPVGADIGCGSGRWAMLAAARTGHLHLVDASAEAIAVARRNLAAVANVSFHHASVAAIPLPDSSLDFAYSLGVLHHVPDTAAAIRAVARKLKPGAPFLVYLYYALDNRPLWYRALWRATDLVRQILSRAPAPLRYAASQAIAATVYWPLARMALLLDRLDLLPGSMPLAFYRRRSFYVMRTDAYDRFCTRLEQRFTRAEIESMLEEAGFRDVAFSDSAPFWCAVGRKG